MQLIRKFLVPGQLFLFMVTLGILTVPASKAQQTRIYTDPDKVFKDAQQLFQQEKYAVAMQLFRQTIDNIGYFQETSRSLVKTDATYYYTVCALKLGQPNAEKLALDFLALYNNNARE